MERKTRNETKDQGEQKWKKVKWVEREKEGSVFSEIIHDSKKKCERVKDRNGSNDCNVTHR